LNQPGGPQRRAGGRRVTAVLYSSQIINERLLMELKPLSRDDFEKLSTEESHTNRAYLYLRIFDFICHQDKISEQIGLVPTGTRQRGEEYIITLGKNKKQLKRISDITLWEYERKIVSNDFIGDLVEAFITDVIEPRIAEINGLADPKRIIFNITHYYYTSNNPGVFISSKQMKTLADINAELDVDIYSLHD